MSSSCDGSWLAATRSSSECKSCSTPNGNRRNICKTPHCCLVVSRIASSGSLESAREQAGLRLQLDEAHCASGFKPRATPGQHNDLIDPAEMMTRAFHLWQRTRWPGHQGRVGYAHTLFNVYVLRRLMLLCMRLWDTETPSAGERLLQLQGVLDELCRTTPADQPVFVRDARWLFPLAQSPTTDELHGYFEVAERIAATLSDEDRIEIHKASVRMAGGHLRSQLRHVSTQKGVSLDEHSLVFEHAQIERPRSGDADPGSRAAARGV